MRRSQIGLLRTGSAAAILGAAVFACISGSGHTLPFIGLLTCALCGAGVAVRAATRQRERRLPWLLLAVALLVLSGLSAASLAGRRVDDSTWVSRQLERANQRLDDAVAHSESRQDALRRFAQHALVTLQPGIAIAREPFDLCRSLLDTWHAEHGNGALDSLAVVLWRGDQRLGWAGPVVPMMDPEQRLFHDDRWWVLRAESPAPDADSLWVECQLRMAPVSALGLEFPVPAAIHRQVDWEPRSQDRRLGGDVHRGLHLVQDVAIGPAEESGSQPLLRLSIQIQGRTAQENRRQAMLGMARNLVLGLAGLAWGAAAAALAGFWVCAWLVRWFWVKTDLVRSLALCIPEPLHSMGPGHPGSLLDPAYFATTYAGGWLASGADALLSALLVAGTMRWIWHRMKPRNAAPSTTGRHVWRSLLWVPPCAWLMYRLWHLWQELAANANARLIGLNVPIDAWSFWALHAVILLISLSAGLAMLLLAVRLIGGMPAGLRSTARPYWLAAGLLLVVLFNYTALSYAYGRLERDWLVRKAEEITQPQDDWISFLLEDVLGEMAIHDTGEPDPPPSIGGSGSLRHSMPAFRLWRRSAVRDLNLPAMIEIFDQDGIRTSMFASGFLRDAQYEVVHVDPWRRLSEERPHDEERLEVHVQSETRRYPNGRERILRGEIPRYDGRGWLRLELPVQSWRVSSLALEHLTSADHDAGGYRPRREVERSLLLMLGDDQGWLDAGFGALPDADAQRAIASLRDGTASWVTIDLDGSRWLCRWAYLAPGPETRSQEGFLIGLERPGVVDIMLDVGRLLLLNVLMLGAWLLVTSLIPRRGRWQPGFQGRFLLGYLAIGVVLLGVAGALADRQTFQRIDQEARARAHDGLITATGQLHGLLIEQARAIAGSEYLEVLLAGRLGSERPYGPQMMRHVMVFGPAGEMLLDETLSDLDRDEVRLLLAALREGPMVVVEQAGLLHLGVLIPLESGTMFYRQRIDEQLLPALAEVIGGEVTLRLDAEVVEASHPGRVLGGDNPLLFSPELMESFLRRPGQPILHPRPQGLAFTGGIALPALSFSAEEPLQRRALPAVLSVEFPARERDYMTQRHRMGLFLAGLITLLLLTAFGLAMILTWNVFEPLRVLLSATRRLAGGDYSAPLPPAGSDEVGRLASGFRLMRDRLHEAQAVLAARERFLQAVLDQVPAGVVVWEDSGRLAVWNPSAAAIMARFYPDLPDGHEPADWALQLRHDVREHLPAEGGALTSQDGSRTVRVGRAPLELGGEAPHELLVCEDLTEFLAAKKLALNAELARQVAHEIKNPLTPIQLSAQLLLQAYQDRHPRLDDIVTDAVRRIVEQVELLRSIAGEFSLLGRPGKLVCEPLDLADIVMQVVQRYRGRADAGGPRVVVADDMLPPVLGHRESLIKILGNLMQNSIDAVAKPSDLELTIAWKVEPDTVTLLWSDNGTGIGSDVAMRLFDPYFSTKSKGTGLGLAICRNLLDMMDGAIDLTNRIDGRGSVARVALRRLDADADPARTGAPAQ
jgi:signal transduction histidine kinase